MEVKNPGAHTVPSAVGLCSKDRHPNQQRHVNRERYRRCDCSHHRRDLPQGLLHARACHHPSRSVEIRMFAEGRSGKPHFRTLEYKTDLVLNPRRQMVPARWRGLGLRCGDGHRCPSRVGTYPAGKVPPEHKQGISRHADSCEESACGRHSRRRRGVASEGDLAQDGKAGFNGVLGHGWLRPHNCSRDSRVSRRRTTRQ